MIIKASLRDAATPVNALRAQGLVPAEFYGPGVPNQHLSVVSKDLAIALREAGESTVITLEVAGKKFPARIQDIQRDVLGMEFQHVDFRAVRMDQKTAVHVHLEFVGVSPSVKAGHIVNHVMTEVEVEGLPGDIPHHFEVDISGLVNPGDSLHAKDISLPKTLKLLTPEDAILVSVAEFHEEVEEVTPVVAAAVEGEAAAEASKEAGETPAEK
jgi:large subunit ribosomal protein L25